MIIVISDTSPINLVLIGKQHILPILFSQVVIPEAVLGELQAAAAPPEVRRWVSSPPGWLQVKQPAGPPESSLSHLDAGEREAIQLAEELKADLLIIDEQTERRRSNEDFLSSALWQSWRVQLNAGCLIWRSSWLN